MADFQYTNPRCTGTFVLSGVPCTPDRGELMRAIVHGCEALIRDLLDQYGHVDRSALSIRLEWTPGAFMESHHGD